MWLSIASKLVPGIIKTGMSIASNRRRTKELTDIEFGSKRGNPETISLFDE